MNALPDIPAMQRAFLRKDAAFDGIFFVGIRTTGIFCRPVCRAKPAKPTNMEFFASAREALHHGYRPCRLCRPLDSGRQPPPLVTALMKLVEQDPATRLTGPDLQARGIDPTTARRQFQRYCHMTFAAYQRARRMGQALVEIRAGHSITHAQVGAGFESASGFRAACERLFGAAASGAAGINVLAARWLTTPLGPMLAIASDDGIVLLDFVDRKGLHSAIQRLRRRFVTPAGQAVIAPAPHRHLDQLAGELDDYFAARRRQFTVPLDPPGTDFQRAAWRYLQTIPPGETRSYAEQARAIGRPGAIRAVGRANGMNYLAIVIPCHRVIASDGRLAGYGGGLARKQWLLDHERNRRRVGP